MSEPKSVFQFFNAFQEEKNPSCRRWDDLQEQHTSRDWLRHSTVDSRSLRPQSMVHSGPPPTAASCRTSTLLSVRRNLKDTEERTVRKKKGKTQTRKMQFKPEALRLRGEGADIGAEMKEASVREDQNL